ncbi:MAG: P-II family nitrogen regulator [Chthoniobacteraceae bacterium]
MKKIEAIIKPSNVEQVKEALMDLGIRGITTADVRGFGREYAHTEVFRGSKHAVNFIPEVKMEITVQDFQLDEATAILLKATGAGKLDEGNLLIIPVETALEHSVA